MVKHFSIRKKLYLPSYVKKASSGKHPAEAFLICGQGTGFQPGVPS
jgi:hypothetical protein